MRVVPSRISNLERKRGQYQDYGFVRAKRQRNVASKRRYLRNVRKEPCRGCGFVTFVTFGGARQSEGRQPRRRRAPTGSDQSYADRRSRGVSWPTAPEGSVMSITLVFSTFYVVLKKLKKIHTV